MKPPFVPPPGRDDCADCHPDEVDGFAKTSMGRAFYRPKGAPAMEDFSPERSKVYDPKTKIWFRTYVDDEGRWWQEESIPRYGYKRAVEVVYVMGSGDHARSYVGLVDGELVQLPLTWYAIRRVWDLSPGYEHDNFRFSRVIRPQCAFCHNDVYPLRKGSVSGYQQPFAEGIGCARCHGDGTAHIQARLDGKEPAADKPDPWIHNPAHSPRIEQRRVCDQCHLQGKSRMLRAGKTWDAHDATKPLDDFVFIYMDLARGGSKSGFGSYGDRLVRSKCTTASGDTLACTTCHNPHQPSTVASQRAACLGCHQIEQCGDAHGSAPDADCAKCHMRRAEITDIPHARLTDHLIRKKSADDKPRPAPMGRLVEMLGHNNFDDDPSYRLMSGMAHYEAYRIGGGDQRYLRRALVELRIALRHFPNHGDAWVAYARAIGDEGNALESGKAYEKAASLETSSQEWRLGYMRKLLEESKPADVERIARGGLAVQPDHGPLLRFMGQALMDQQKFTPAIEALKRADELTPSRAAIANDLGVIALKQDRTDEAIEWFETALERDGANETARLNLADAWRKKAEFDKARRYAEQVLRWNPDSVEAKMALGTIMKESGGLRLPPPVMLPDSP